MRVITLATLLLMTLGLSSAELEEITLEDGRTLVGVLDKVDGQVRITLFKKGKRLGATYVEESEIMSRTQIGETVEIRPKKRLDQDPLGTIASGANQPTAPDSRRMIKEKRDLLAIESQIKALNKELRDAQLAYQRAYDKYREACLEINDRHWTRIIKGLERRKVPKLEPKDLDRLAPEEPLQMRAQALSEKVARLVRGPEAHRRGKIAFALMKDAEATAILLKAYSIDHQSMEGPSEFWPRQLEMVGRLYMQEENE